MEWTITKHNIPILMRILIVLASFLLTVSLSGQSYMTKSTASGKAMKPYRKANELLTKKQYDKAIAEYTKTIQLCPSFIDAYLERGDTYIGQKQDEKGEADLLKAISLDPNYKPKVLFVLAALQWRLDKYDDVIKHAQMLLDSDYKSKVVRDKSERLLIQAKFAKVAVKNPLPFDPQPLSDNINTTDQHEYLPSLSADDRIMIFNRRRGQMTGTEDFYLSEKDEKGLWKKAVPFHNLNTTNNEAALTITADGNVIVFTAKDRPNGYGNFDLFISEKSNGKWSNPKNMGAGVNSSAWDSQPSISANGKYLFFTSKRKGGFGKSDIYVCKRFEDGIWSKPINLGPKINTAENDESPFIHADGNSFYFMSEGHPGMGGFDLFKVRQEQPFKWGEVKNLGYPINTKGEQGALFINLDGSKGYYANGEKGTSLDIYSFDMPESIRPDPVTYVKGTVRDAITGAPIQANVLLYPSSNPKDETKVQTNPDGTFLLALPIGVDYSLAVNQTGYTFYSDRFEMGAGESVDEPFLIDIPLQELVPVVASTPTTEVVAPKPIILKNVFFETGSADLRSESFIELDKLYQLLVASPSIRIQVNGHTDDVGDDTANQALSERRAKSVSQYIIGKGIDTNRVDFKGYGEIQPIADNGTDEGRAQNRRTEFVVVK